MRTISLINASLFAVVACAGLTGCGDPLSVASTAGQAAYKTVKGADADVTPIRLLAASKLAPYQSLQLTEVTTDVPPICTPHVLGKVREGLRDELNDSSTKKAFPGGGPVLQVAVVCRFAKAGGTIGGEGRLDWMVTLKDESGDEMGLLFIEGVSGSPLQHGITDMAKENTHALVKFLAKQRKGK